MYIAVMGNPFECAGHVIILGKQSMADKRSTECISRMFMFRLLIYGDCKRGCLAGKEAGWSLTPGPFQVAN